MFYEFHCQKGLSACKGYNDEEYNDCCSDPMTGLIVSWAGFRRTPADIFHAKQMLKTVQGNKAARTPCFMDCDTSYGRLALHFSGLLSIDEFWYTKPATSNKGGQRLSSCYRFRRGVSRSRTDLPATRRYVQANRPSGSPSDL